MILNKIKFEDKGFYLDYGVDLNFYVCGITTKNSSLNYSYHTIETEEEKEVVKKSRRKLLQEVSFQNLVTLKQIHSDIIYVVGENNINFFSESQVEGDGLITDMKNTLIGVLTADCIPLIYLSKREKICGVVHAGWRGVYKGIHSKMLDYFKEFGILPEEILIIVGAHIRKCCYSVGEEMLNYFTDKYFLKKGRGLYLSLLDIVVDDFISCGINRNHISYLDVCSYCNKGLFYSYRRGESRGRNLTFVGIKVR